ncbi:hypothetical protein A176_006400 [Myxococcus hansupus]|uniref:Uncharacterized protein n=1 Tax=Pseudomyxococcus hansupus TaxID=1297742 RepID=A0A0H4X6H6_9BACT|nr:hypothetical protein A176_006400 [Myxococcus hansupus]
MEVDNAPGPSRSSGSSSRREGYSPRSSPNGQQPSHRTSRAPWPRNGEAALTCPAGSPGPWGARR